MNTPKLYVLVRDEFRAAYCAAQAIHAVALFFKDQQKSFEAWNNSTVVVLGVRYPRGLSEWRDRLFAEGIPHSVWREPDQNDQITAIACYHTGELFKGLRTLT